MVQNLEMWTFDTILNFELYLQGMGILEPRPIQEVNYISKLQEQSH